MSATREVFLRVSLRGVEPVQYATQPGQGARGTFWLVRRVPGAVPDAAVARAFAFTRVGDPGTFVVPFDALGEGKTWRLPERPTQVHSRQVVRVPHGPRSQQYAVLINGGPWGCRWIKRWQVWGEVVQLPEPVGKDTRRASPGLGPAHFLTLEQLQERLDGRSKSRLRERHAAPTRDALVLVTEELGRRIAGCDPLPANRAEALRRHLVSALREVEP
jgi:hypothetical protein